MHAVTTPTPTVLYYCSSTPIIINKDNLAYLAALFPESELMREQLINKRWRPKQALASGQSSFTPGLLPSTPGITPPTPGIMAPPTPNITDSYLASDSGTNLLYQQQSYRDSQSFSSLLSTNIISGQKEQVLFLLVLVGLDPPSLPPSLPHLLSSLDLTPSEEGGCPP